ncbi:LPD38 domain-containing protein [Bacteroides cellulosilyticus]|uniref:LPD38 domain-containing protein n=1 Tax=Bacteroides cellulosilyticus TaxID=246787 RepID=UPI00076055E0|nr:LPD38 domain-containing protein [Bacteroides cellulosilyticus]KWR54323.1 DNA methylase [Bacteroides cellulosilyticus]
MDTKDNVGLLYSALKKQGFNDIGDENIFRSKMANENNRKILYEALNKKGFNDIGDYDTFNSKLNTNSPSILHQEQSQPRPKSPYVEGKGEDTMIFGVPYADYQQMTPEEQSKQYSAAIEKRKNDEKDFFSNYISGQLGEIDSELSNKREPLPMPAGSAFIPSSAVGAAQRFGNDDTKETQDRYTSLHAAKNLLDDANKLVEEVKKGDTGFFSSLGRGFKDKFMDTDNWTMGLTDTAYSGLLRKAIEKEESGEELSPEESKLLDAAAVNMATQAYFSSDMSRGYKAGSTTAQSIPFMLEFAVNPVSSSGNALAKGLLKHGLKRFGRVATSNAAKVAGRLVGDAAAAAGMTATSSIGRVASGTNERMIGDVQAKVEDGDIKYAGRENSMNFGEALGKSAISNFLENQSEMFFNAFAGGGKLAKEALNKFIPGFSKLSNSEIVQLISKIKNNPTIKNVAQRTQFHGLLGEYAEEVYNNFANIPLGEMTVEQATDLDNNIDTFLGLAPTSAAFGLLGLGGMAREKYTTQRNLHRFKEGLNEEDQALFDELQQVINAGDKETTKAFIKRTLTDEKLTQEEKKERVFAVQDMQEERVLEDVQNEDVSAGVTSEDIEANKIDIYRNFKRAERKVNSLLPEEIVSQLDAVSDLGQFASTNNLNEQQVSALADYLPAKEIFSQYVDHTNKRKEEAKMQAREQAMADVERISNPETGLVIQAKHKFADNPVYLVGGNLSFGEDGFLDRDNSSETIYYVDETGERKMAQAEDFDSVLSEVPIDDMIVQAEINAEQDFVTNEEESLRSPDIPAPVRGETVMMDGSRYLIEGDNMDDPGQSVMAIKLDDAGEIDIENGDERPISIDDYYSLKESEMWQDDIVPAPLLEETLQTEETPLESEVIQEETDQVSVPVEGESVKEETPEQRLQKVLDTLPKKKDGSIDYKSMTPQQQFDYTSAVDSPEVAIEDLKGDVAAKNEELEKINARLAKATGGERVELRDLIRSKKKELDELNTFFQSVVPEQSDTSESMETSQVPEEVRTDEDYISWVADNSDDANEVLGAYSAAKDLASHEQTLKPWQRELLGRKVSTSSFNRFGDRNQITGALAKGWLRKDGQEIDTIAQELSENGVEVTEQDIVDFMLTNPSNHVSQVSDTMRSLSSKFSEIATKEMGIPVGGPESNTGRLYIKLKEADQKIDKLTDKQKNEIEEALTADMDISDTQRTYSYYEVLDDYVQQYDQFRNEFDKEAADEAIIQKIEESNPELYHGGFTADELDYIYSQIENNNGTEGQAEDSRENQSPLSGEEVEQHEESGAPEVAATENRESEEQNNGIVPNEQFEVIKEQKPVNIEQLTVNDLSVVEPSSSTQENGNNALNSEDYSVNLQGENQKVNENDEVSESIPQGEHGTLPEISGEQEEPVYQLRRRIEEASRNASESERGRGHQQEVNQMIEAQAKESGLWTPIQNLSNLGTPFLSGNENDTYLDRENDAVYKMNNLVNSKNLPELFKRIDLHNELFPQTKYELVGFTGFGNGGAIYPIYKQEYIDNAEFATPEEIGNYMQALGFNKTGEAEYSNGDVIISDLRPRNVLKDTEGDIYVIDADFKRNIPTPKENNPAQFVSPLLEPGEDVLDYANRISESKHLFDAEQEVDINPTEAQKSAGNYKKGHIKIDGYDITIETPKGSERSGVDTNGQPWSVTMNNTYGYIRGTEGVDGDHIDVFLSDNPAGGKVYIIDQMNEDGSFDEHKVMYGFNSALAAKRAYMKNYSPGWKGLGKTTEVSKEVFNEWVKSSKRKTKPFAEYKIAKENADNIAEIQSEDVVQADTVEYGVSNKLVSKDRYEELKNKLRGKLGQMNIGFDPELFSIGAEMAAYHIEAGARKFGDFAQRMIEDVGDAVRPYLKSFYEGARQFPGMEDFQKDMDEYHAVKDFDTESFDKAVEPIDKATLPAKESKSNNRKSSENTISSQKSESNKPAEMQDLFNQNLEDHGEQRNSEERNPDTDRSMGGKTREEAVRTERRRNDTGVHGHNVPDTDRSGRIPESTGRVVSSVKVQRNRNNYNFGENHIDVPAGDVAKLKANIDAIRTLREVENSGKPATEQQKAKLARYVGWGGLANALDENKFKASERSWIADANWNAKYLPYYKQLKELLSPEEFRSAVQSTTTSHYTPEPIIRNLWNIATRVGFTGGMISEPAMGVGHILGLMPKGIAENSQISGFEIDSLSGRISKALYPDANTKVQGYETEFAPQSKDLVITNVPFGKDAPYDKFLDKSLRKKLGGAYNLHNYFIAKGLLELKENGLGVFITSSATMDGADSRFREFVAGNGFDMVGAIRLPNDAFQKNAGTSVTADILVFRKRKAGEVANGVNYISTTPVGEGTYEEKGEKRTKPIMINEYFAARPEMMLGEMMTAFDAGSGGLYSGASQTLKARSGLDLSQAISEAIGKLPENILGKVENSAVVKDKEQTTQKDGTLTVKDGKIYVAMSGVLEPVPVKETFTYNGKLQKTVDAVQSYNDLKSTLKKLITAEQSLDIAPEPIRKELNKQYDAFAKKYGTLNRNKALDNVLVEDFERYLPLSLEDVTKVPSATGKSSVYQITKGKGILDKRVSYPVKEPSKADNLQDAVNISRSYRGAIDIPYISQLIAKSEEEVIDDMLRDGVAYRDPLTGDLIDRGTYLSGNVKEKLEEARTAAERDPAFEKNVEELINVQPEMIRFGDISYRLGTPWIPTEFIDKFAEDVLGLSDTGLNFVSVLNEYVTGKSISVADYAKAGIYKTDRLGTINLFEAALNQRKPKVYDEIKNGEQKIRVVNEVETQAAAEKVMEISDKFIEYIDGQKAFHKELERIYNDKYNNFRLKEYDLPAFEHYPNSNTEITLRAHQMKAVQRSFGESTLYAHQVGTGKTFTMITTAMEMRRLGIARKPMIVVQNATLEDFVKDFYKLYPGANVLAPGKDERSADNRRRLFNLIATGDFDAIIIPQSFMQFIPDDEGRKKELIQQKIDEYERVIEATENDSLRRRLEKEVADLQNQFEGVEKPKKRSVKDRAKAENRIKTKMERQLDRRTDDVLTFEQMGIDALFIDEAHNYKKIGFVSKMSNVKGIDTTASQRANSLLLKAKWVQEKNNGRNVILATGTPITNTMAEVWTMMNFVAPDILEAYNIQTFDEFATTFGTVEPSLEFTATGNFKIADRFKSYVNVPELVKAFRSHADVVLTEDVEEFQESSSIPKLRDGAMTNIVIDKNEDLEDVMQILISELERFSKMSGKEKRRMSALPLVVFTKAKQAAIDLRLLNPSFADNPNSKTNQVVSNVVKLYNESNADKGAQLIFCDSYQSPGEQPKMDLFDYDPNTPRFNLYEDIKQKLIAQGIPAKEIAIINNYDGERRKGLFEKVRSGDVRILLGSTEKMGVGVNVQDRLYGLHHIDAPVRPMDFEQRNGRILRQGNNYALWGKPVNVVTYGVQGTLDATAYDRLRIKQNFINQMMKGNVSGRIMEEQDDEDPSGMTFNQMAATLSGDKTAQLLFVAENLLKKLRNLKRSDANSKSGMAESIEYARNRIIHDKGQKKVYERAYKTISEYFPDGVESVTVDGKTYTEKFGPALEPVIASYEDAYSLNRGTAPLKIMLNNSKAEVIVHFNEGRMVYELYAGNEHIVEGRQFNGGKGLMSSIEHQLKAVEKNLSDIDEKIASYEKRVQGLTEAMNTPWGREDELKAAEKEVEGLKKQLEEKAKASDENKKYRIAEDESTRNSKRLSSVIVEQAKMLNTPVRIINSIDELPNDDDARIQIENGSNVKGWFDSKTKEVVVYLPNAVSVEDAQATVLHETVGHRGLNEVFGEQYDDFIDKVFENAIPATRRKIIDLGIKRGYDFHLATEEYLAELAEKGFERENGFLQTIKSLLTDMLRRAKIKLGFRLNDGDLRYMLWRTYQLKTEGHSTDAFAKDMSMRYKLKVGNYRETPVRKKYRSDNATAEKDVAKHLYEARTLDRMYKYQEAYQDSMLGLKTLQEALEKETDKPIADYENAYMAENQLSSRNSFEQEFYKMNFFDPIMSEVNKLIKTGVEYDDILDYLKAKHGLERNEEFAKRAAEKAKEPFLEKLNDLEKLLANGGIDGLTFDDERDNLKSEMEEAAEDAYFEARGKDFSGLSSLTSEKENFTTEAEKLVSTFEEANETTVLWEKINAATKESLKKTYECGLMTKDVYQKVSTMFKYYIPLRGWKEDTAADVYDYIMEERPIFNVPVKKMEGRVSEADDPLATIANMAESAIMQGNRNLMKQRFLAMVINHPTSLATVKQMWYTYDGVRDEWQQALPEIPEDATGEEVAALVEEFERRMVELAREGLARKGRLEVPYRALPREQRQHMVIVKKDGLEYTVYINGNPRAAQAMNGLTNPDSGSHKLVNLVKRINRQMAANFTTRNPAFVISNLARDVIFSTSAITIKEDHKYSSRFRRNLIKNGLGLRLGELLYKSEKNSLDLNNELERYFSEFLKNGGETGYTALHSVEEHRKMIERSIMDAKGLVDLGRIFGVKPGKVTVPTTMGIVPAFQFMAKWTEFGNRCAEDVSRFTTYMTSRQMGRSISRSISDAKEVTVNFNKKGAGGLGATTFKSLFLFFNAAVQSLANFANLAKANPKRFSAAIGGFTAAGILLPIMNNLLIGMFGGDDDKDAYENLPEWVRKNNFCFWLGGDKFLTIPIPIELRAFYGAGELFRSYMEGKGDNRNIGMELMGQFTELLPINPFGGGEWNIPKGTPTKNIVGTVVGNLMPDAGKPVYQVAQNRNFFGKPIYKDNFNELMPEWTKAYAGTSKALVSSAKLLNEVTGSDKYDRGLLNMNPAIFEHFFESYFGGLGKTINQVGKTVSMIWDEDERMWRSVPVLNRFLSGGDERNVFSRVNEAYFNYLGEYKVVENRLRGYKKEIKTGNEQYRAKLKELENSSEYERYSVLKKYQKRVKSYQDLIKEETDRETRKAYETALNLLKAEIVEELRSIK